MAGSDQSSHPRGWQVRRVSATPWSTTTAPAWRWSDLDVFVIAEPDRTTALRQALTEVQSDLGELKLGLTVLSQAQCRTGAVTSRLLHVMTLLDTGSLLPL
ncbi:hypothetical protein ACFVJH_23405 [Streptomyces decoyicus]|uniref:hypothetical protein n=1 Tax=Streptomyces decoyicus TaxID=249567 RepID=UPI00363B44C9